MPILWRKNLETGVRDIDMQHRELINRMSALLEATEEGREANEVLELLDFLKQYVIVHFETEGLLMAQYEYPDLETHVKEHRLLVQDLERMDEEFIRRHNPERLAAQLESRLVEWLLTHISLVDKRLGSYILRKQQEQAPG